MKPFNLSKSTKVEDMSPGDIVLHGDVVIYRVDELPKEFQEFTPVQDDCLAYGELTGHVHKLCDGEFELREDMKTNTRHLRIVEPTALRHQEHHEILLPPGDYRIGIQREYDPFTKRIREVQD